MKILERTLAEAKSRAGGAPGYEPLAVIVRQLEAMARWTAGGRTPTPDERGLIDIGVVAARELEPAETDEEDDFNLRLHELNGYFEDWPPDQPSGAEPPDGGA